MEHTLQKFLDQAEELVEIEGAHEELLDALQCAESMLPDSAALLCRSAHLLYRYGMLNQKGRFFLLALGKLQAAEEKNPLFFESSSEWWHLWGNVLVQLGRLLSDLNFFEMALEKYQKTEKTSIAPSANLYWDWAEALSMMGQLSGELTDMQQAISKFAHAKMLGERSTFFRIEFGRALVFYGKLKGDPHYLEEALSLFREVIGDSYFPGIEPSIALIIAFRECALCMKDLYFLTHKEEYFLQADRVFQEAVLLSSKNGSLWLDWGELYVWGAWIKRSLELAETGLEKLTSSKVKECDPLRASALLSMGLVIIGLFLEELKLIKDGRDRIQSRDPHDSPQLFFSYGFACLGEALFFSDPFLFSKAASIFEQGLEQDAFASHNWHALFQTYMAWGLNLKDVLITRKGVQAIARLCRLRPNSYLHLNEWGVSLLRLKELEDDPDKRLECVEEAILRFEHSFSFSEEIETLYNWGCALDQLGDLTGDEEHYEKAIEFLFQVYDKQPDAIHVCYQLGLALSHLGELLGDIETFQQAIYYLETAAKMDMEDEAIWCELGYAYLNLSELARDPILPENSEEMRREAEKKLLRAAQLGSPDACYHLACLYSLSEMIESSMHYLRKTESANFLPPVEELQQDEWLARVRNTEAFQEFLILREKNG